MKVKFETISPTPVGGSINMSVEFDVPDGASTSEVEQLSRAALDVHREVSETQQAWVVEYLAAQPQPQPRPNRAERRRAR